MIFELRLEASFNPSVNFCYTLPQIILRSMLDMPPGSLLMRKNKISASLSLSIIL